VKVPDNLRKSGFQCCVLNARSVVSKRFDLMGYLIVDILAITETFLDSTVHDSHIISSGYAVFRKDRDRYGDGFSTGRN